MFTGADTRVGGLVSGEGGGGGMGMGSTVENIYTVRLILMLYVLLNI